MPVFRILQMMSPFPPVDILQVDFLALKNPAPGQAVWGKYSLPGKGLSGRCTGICRILKPKAVRISNSENPGSCLPGK